MGTDKLWGGETDKAVANFPVSGHPIPAPVVHWLGRIKAAAARANAELGLLDAEKAERIAAAGDSIAQGDHDDQFPIDVFQTGSGTSSNMNANEVIAALAGDDVHANDDVNMGQSSNESTSACTWRRSIEPSTIADLDGDLARSPGEAGRSATCQSGDPLIYALPVTLARNRGLRGEVRRACAREDALPRLGRFRRRHGRARLEHPRGSPPECARACTRRRASFRRSAIRSSPGFARRARRAVGALRWLPSATRRSRRSSFLAPAAAGLSEISCPSCRMARRSACKVNRSSVVTPGFCE